jgi:hypothetical protein
MKHWEVIADNLSKAGWSWGCVSAIDSNGRTVWITDAHRDGKRFVVRADEKLTAFVELESEIWAERLMWRRWRRRLFHRRGHGHNPARLKLLCLRFQDMAVLGRSAWRCRRSTRHIDFSILLFLRLLPLACGESR